MEKTVTEIKLSLDENQHKFHAVIDFNPSSGGKIRH